MSYSWAVIKTDYILHLVEQLAEVVLAVVGSKKAKEAEEELAQAVGAWTGLDLDLAVQLSNESLFQLFGAGEMGAEERLLLLGHAIAVRSLVVRQRGELPQALRLQEKAVGLIEHALVKRPGLGGPQVQAVLEALFAQEGSDSDA